MSSQYVDTADYEPMLEVNTGRRMNTFQKWFIGFFAALVICTTCSVASMIVTVTHEQKPSYPQTTRQIVGDHSNNRAHYLATGELPAAFSVNESYILPPTDQANIGSCWSFAMVYLLESQYHAQGVEKGFLDMNTYVPFSKQAWFSWLGKMCHLHPEVKACNYGGLMSNSSEDHQIESLYYFWQAWKEEAENAILPESICPYKSIPDDTPKEEFNFFDCPNLDFALGEKQNPIKWTIKNTKTVYNLQAIKELLIESGRALGIGVPLPNLVYWVPCAGSPYENSEDCKAKTYKCPDYSSASKDDYCYKLTLDARQQDGVFLAADDPKYMSELGGHAMNIVGYNDEWLYRNRFQSPESSGQLKGGLILHNSWRGEGHSVKYLMGVESEENEAVRCPNHKTPLNWIPATLKCVQEQAAAGAINYTHLMCSSDIKRVRGKGITNKADLLYCKDSSHCDVNKLYVLKRGGVTTTAGDFNAYSDADVKLNANGLAEVSLIEIDNSTTPFTITEKTITDAPFWAMSKYFSPTDFVANNMEECGYWMLPYKTIENMQRINWDLLDNFRAFDVEIEFDERSYLQSAASAGFNTTLLKESTKTRTPMEFDGPLPYQYIY